MFPHVNGDNRGEIDIAELVVANPDEVEHSCFFVVEGECPTDTAHGECCLFNAGDEHIKGTELFGCFFVKRASFGRHGCAVFKRAEVELVIFDTGELKGDTAGESRGNHCRVITRLAHFGDFVIVSVQVGNIALVEPKVSFHCLLRYAVYGGYGVIFRFVVHSVSFFFCTGSVPYR